MNSSGKKLNILYVVYWGATEPLGQSLVLPAVKELADLGTQLTLVTFEKPKDLLRHAELEELQASLEERGINWLGLRYHKRPKLPATVFDIVQGCARSLIASLRRRPDIIHARTFIGGLIGLALATVLRAKLIYHNEGFYPDEQVDAGIWHQSSRQYKVAKALEGLLYSRADAVIALSHKAKTVIENFPRVHREGTPIAVVPSCVDLERFNQTRSAKIDPGNTFRLVYVGSVGGRYDFERVVRFAFIVSQHRSVQLSVLTQSDKRVVSNILDRSGLPSAAWTVDQVPHRQMPAELAEQNAGVHFLPQGLADFGGSPTKIGEYWAAGLPAVVTPDLGDTDDIILREKVGVVVRGHSDEDYRLAAIELFNLMEDPE